MQNKTRATKNIISRRFLKKSIMLSSNSHNSLKTTNLNDYKYEKINIRKYSNRTSNNIERYLDDILNSSKNLSEIRDSVFSLENISEIRKICNFKLFNSLNILKKENNNLIKNEDDDFGISLVGRMSYLFFPYNVLTYPFSISGNARDDISFSIEKIEKNKVKSRNKDISLEDILNNSNIVEFYPDMTSDSLDITSTQNIKFRLEIKSKANDYEKRIGESKNLPFLEFEDEFDKITECGSSVFNKIAINIIEMLHLNIRDFKLLYFQNEEEIDTFINNNRSILLMINDLIEVYSELYLLNFSRIQNEYMTDYFIKKAKSDKEILTEEFNFVNLEGSLPVNGRIKELSTIEEEKLVFDQIYQKINSTFENESSLKISDIVTDHALIRNNHIIWNVYRSLLQSDVYQAFNFDIINGFIDYQDKLENMSREELTFSKTLSKMLNYIDDRFKMFYFTVDKYFYNYMFINTFGKRMFNNLYFNNKIENFLINKREETGLDFYEDEDFFIKQKEIEEIVLNESIPQFDQNSRIVDENYYNSSFYTFGLDFIDSLDIKYNNIIKFTTYIVDIFNLNHIYLPKSYYFSPLFSKKGNLKVEDFTDALNITDPINYYNLDKNIENRIGLINYKELLDSSLEENAYFIDLIKSKFNIENDEIAKLIFNQMIYSHVNSEKNESFIKNVYNINHIDDVEIEYDEQIVKSMFSLSESEFFNVFEIKKERVFSKDGSILESAKKLKNTDFYIFHSLLEKLSKIGDFKEIFLKNYYETYTLSINPKDYFYYDLTGTTSSFEQNNIEKYNTESWDDSIISYIKTNIANLPESIGLLKKSNLDINNTKIIIKAEII